MKTGKICAKQYLITSHFVMRNCLESKEFIMSNFGTGQMWRQCFMKREFSNPLSETTKHQSHDQSVVWILPRSTQPCDIEQLVLKAKGLPSSNQV